MSRLAWYLIYTKARQESVAQSNLERQNFPVYLPFCQVKKRVRGIYTSVREPMFPRYLFIQLDKINDNWGPIRSTRGVAKMVQFSGIPASVPDLLIQSIREYGLQYDQAASAASVFLIGEQIKVCDGPFAGHDGLFHEASGIKRCKILLEVVGRETLLEIDQNDLERISC